MSSVVTTDQKFRWVESIHFWRKRKAIGIFRPEVIWLRLYVFNSSFGSFVGYHIVHNGHFKISSLRFKIITLLPTPFRWKWFIDFTFDRHSFLLIWLMFGFSDRFKSNFFVSRKRTVSMQKKLLRMKAVIKPKRANCHVSGGKIEDDSSPFIRRQIGVFLVEIIS